MRKFVFAVFTCCSLAATGSVLAQGSASSAPSPAGMSQGPSQLHESMMSGMQKMQSMQPTGDTDKDFAAMMRMHHQQAVEMAKVEVQHGKSPQLKAMAQKMMKDQQKEIAQLDQWLAKNK